MIFINSLRGGGVICSRQNQIAPYIQQEYNPQVFEFLENFNQNIKVIEEKASLAANQTESSEIKIAIQWFTFQEQNIYKLNKNKSSVKESYDLIIEGTKRLLNSCLIYIKTNQLICLQILQITTSLSKVLFSYHLINNQRFMEFKYQEQICETCEKLRIQMEIEKNDLIQNQIELYLFLTQTAFEIAPNNSNQRNEIIEGCLKGIITSIIEMKPNQELFESLFQGAQYLFKEIINNTNKKRKQYQIYYQLDMLLWEVISDFQNNKNINLEQIIQKIEAMYKMIVKGSVNWEDHFLWVEMIRKIIIYNPLLTKKRLNQVVTSLKLEIKAINQIWEDYKAKGLLKQVNFIKNTGLIILNQLENKRIQQLDKIILEYSFKGWKKFTLLKEFLMNQQDKIQYTFGSYLKSKLDLVQKDNKIDLNNLAYHTIQKYFSFIIPDKLLVLIKKNYQNLDEVVLILKSLNSDKIVNLTISQNTYKTQIKKLIKNLEEYYQNTQHILKIFQLNQKDQKEVKQPYQNEFIKYNKLIYLLRLLKLTLKQFNEHGTSQNEMYAEDSKMFQQLIEQIQGELQNFNLKEEQLSSLNDQLSKLLKNQTLQGSQFILEVQKVMSHIDQLQLQIQKPKINQNEKEDIQTSFQYQLLRLQCFYEKQNKEIFQDFYNSIIGLRDIFIGYHEIASVQSTKDLISSVQKFINYKALKFIQGSRFNFLKLNLKLICYKESFQNLLTSVQPTELKVLLEIIDFNQYLFDAVKKYPLMNSCDTNVQQVFNEISSLSVTEKELTNKLVEQKGIIKYQLFKLQLEEYQINQERVNLELIKKQFGEILLEQSSSFLLDSINKILKNLQIGRSIKYATDQNFNEDQFKTEKQIYENLFNQLSKFKIQNDFQVGIQLITQTEIVVKIFRNSENKQISISRIQILEVLKELQNKIKQFEGHVNQINKEGSSPQSINNNSFIENLDFLIKLFGYQQARITKQKKIIENIYGEIKKLFDSLDIFQNQEQKIKDEMMESFNNYLQNQIKSFEKLQWTQIDLELIEKEDSQIKLERILIDFQQEIDKSEQNELIIGVHTLINAFDNYTWLKTKIKQLLTNSNYQYNVVLLEEELSIIKIRKLYFGEEMQAPGILEPEDNQFQELSFFQNCTQKYEDFQNNEQWKIKQGLVFIIIQISSNCFSNKIIEFCQKALVQLWAKEKDQRIRTLLKNQSLISMQMQLLDRNWKTQHDRIEGEMKFLLEKIDDLQEQISKEVNLSRREEKLTELDQTTQELDEYIQNISEMGQQLRLITDFLNYLRKGLTRIEGKIKDMKHQLNNIGSDIKFLRGKSVLQLLEIRKWKVLKEAAIKNVKKVYIPLNTLEKGETTQSNLMNIEQFYDKNGEVNEFLLDGKQTVMLIHGIAGSGKSTIAKKIEELIWKLHGEKKLLKNQELIPIYISLPSLKNPMFQAVEEALHQFEYGFDELQFKECKEMLERNEFRFLLIFDGYDEMNLENIQKNIYRSNKLSQNWFNPLVIFTTRSEIFLNQNYAEWFAPEDSRLLKEVRLLKFGQEQIKQYLEKFTLLSIKILIYDTYEWQNQLQNEGSLNEKTFEIIWDKLEQSLLKQNLNKIKTDKLLNNGSIETILLQLKNDQNMPLKINEEIRNLEINLKKLWSVEKYENIMNAVNVYKLVETPYLLEIIVQVLPSMMNKASEIVNLKSNFIKNFSKYLSESLKSVYLTDMFNEQKKIFLLGKDNNIQIEQKLVDLEQFEKIDYHCYALKIWQELEQKQNLFKVLFNQEFNELNSTFQQHIDVESLILNDQIVNKFQIDRIKMVELMCDALKEQNLTSFDFYDEFIRQYYLKQIEKQRNLGKSISIDRFLHDLQQYSTQLAKEMSNRQLTQISYKQQGLLYKDQNKEDNWLNEYFDDDGQQRQYKKDIRSCSLIQQKGFNYQFVHKSIQEFLIAADLYKLLIKSQDIDLKIFSLKIEKFSKIDEKQNIVLNISENEIQKYLDTIPHFKTLSHLDKQQKLNNIHENIQKFICLIENIRDHDFNKVNYTTQIYKETRKYLLKKISNNHHIIKCLQLLVRLTALDQKFIRSGSNSINLLVEMKVKFQDQDYQNINIQNSSIAGGNFVKCNLSGSKFEQVDINGVNLNGAIMIKCKWKNVIIHELHQLIGHSGCVTTVCFSPDSATLASGSKDKSIRLWDVKSGEQRSELKGHSDYVTSVCFSPDGATLASGSRDKSIRLWDVKSGERRSEFKGHSHYVTSVCFSPDGATLASGSRDKSIRLWDVKSGEQLSELKGHSDYVTSICFSPDGATLASGSWDNSIRLWDVKNREQRSQLKGHSHHVTSVCFSPGGATLASGSWDNSIRLWDVKSGEQRSELNGHSAIVASVCFSPDGATLASGSGDESIRLWDLNIFEQIQSQNINTFMLQQTLNSIQNVNISILLINKAFIFQSQKTIIINCQIFNQKGINLCHFLKQKGSIIIEDKLK